MHLSLFRHRGVWVHHDFLANQIALGEAIDHVLDNAQRKAIPLPKRVLVRIRPKGWTEHGAKEHAAFWYDRLGFVPIRWCEVNVVVGTGEETWLRLITSLSAAIVAESKPSLGAKALV